ncbi:hypothetical protein [Sphingomonas sp. MMS24-J13]|uniref:hypothetical protein n=1 Tax=Sphingomonas sp. MMS24-J13 TaxID=3238686 RepID=UPI0038516B1E
MSTDTMYAASDPRSKLSTAQAGSGLSGKDAAFSAAEYALFGQSEPQIDDANGRSWFARGQNFIVAYTEAKPGGTFARSGQVDEYVLLIEFPEPHAVVSANGETAQVPGAHIVMIPPGDSSITFPDGGAFVRLFTTASDDLVALCSNKDAYAQPHPHIPPLQRWPDPPAGFRIRSYSLDVPAQEGRFGRIWRCTTFMVNVFEPVGPRDTTKLSPHHHDDFEQCSLAMGGSYIHHLRWPWTANEAHWREDDHMVCPAPSIAVIPPLSIHTSASIAPENNLLVDIFSPPRRDFSEMPGWVLNADDYPMPQF